MTMMQLKKRKAKVNSLLFGILSVALYAAVFSYADELISYIAKGGVRAVIPVAMVFVFSWVHGTFASNVWTALGIEAAKKAQRKEVEKPAQKTTTARATVNA
jgi:uncharacterized membrane protein HdeD (DUF308 family)